MALWNPAIIGIRTNRSRIVNGVMELGVSIFDREKVGCNDGEVRGVMKSMIDVLYKAVLGSHLVLLFISKSLQIL
jgi:hypothetical protein